MKQKKLKHLIQDTAPRWLVLMLDIYIVATSIMLAFFIGRRLSPSITSDIIMRQLLVVIFITFVAFSIVKLYKGVVRHSGLKDMENVFKSSTLIFIFLLSFSLITKLIDENTLFYIPIPILVLHFLLNVTLLSVSRFAFKYLYKRFYGVLQPVSNILIYGAGEAGIVTSALFDNRNDNEVKVVGFVDDNKRKKANKINGVTIYHSRDIDAEFIANKRVTELIISIQKISSEKLLEITDEYTEYGVKVKIVPPFNSWVNGELASKQIKEINIEDLLGRESIHFENPILEKEFKGKTILVTGAAGSIGSEIVKQVARFDYKQLILLDMAESAIFRLQQYLLSRQYDGVECIVCDVRNKDRMNLIFEEFNPDIVFHASAYKHVPFMEENPYEAVYVNVLGTKVLADLSIKMGVEKFVMISTDKAVNPTNVMGASKRLAELYVSSLKDKSSTKFITTRFGNVLGSNGSVIPTFKAQIKEGGPLTVTHKDITRFFMTIPEACRLVLEAGAMGQGGEIFVFDMGTSVKIFDLAVKMIKLSGLRYPEDIDIKIIGLRPGEKIYEEVLSNEENTMPTYHDRIRIAKVRAVDSESIQQQISELIVVNHSMDKMKIVKKMKVIIPEFISNNSEFSVLDK